MMIIFKNDWMKLMRIEDKYILQYNSGDLINSIKEIEISELDATKAQKDDQSAYEVIIKYQNLENNFDKM